EMQPCAGPVSVTVAGSSAAASIAYPLYTSGFKCPRDGNGSKKSFKSFKQCSPPHRNLPSTANVSEVPRAPPAVLGPRVPVPVLRTPGTETTALESPRHLRSREVPQMLSRAVVPRRSAVHPLRSVPRPHE